jgi:hypothetical protein
VDNHIYFSHRANETIFIPDITNKITKRGIIKAAHPHIVLFEFISAENYKFIGVKIPKHDFDELFAKRSRTPGYQNI